MILFTLINGYFSSFLNGQDRYLRLVKMDDRCQIPEINFNKQLLIWGSSKKSKFEKKIQHEKNGVCKNFCVTSMNFASWMHLTPPKLNVYVCFPLLWFR